MRSIEIFCDGGSRGNPGPAAIGFVVKTDGKIIYRDGEFIGRATNNVAEYTAVLRALEWLIANKKIFNFPQHQSTVPCGTWQAVRGRQFSIFNFFLDSKLVVNQLNGFYKIKSPQLKKLAVKIKNLEGKLTDKISYKKIPREVNKLADALVNRTLNTLIN